MMDAVKWTVCVLAIACITVTEVNCGRRLFNAALGRPARQYQSAQVTGTDHLVKTADLAVDGNADPTWNNGRSCSATAYMGFQWWYVDLGHAYRIHDVVITNVYFDPKEVQQKLRNFSVDIFSEDPELNPSQDPVRCLHYPGVMPSGATERLKCLNRTTGRYVRISKNDTDSLELCEVQVIVEKDQVDFGGPGCHINVVRDQDKNLTQKAALLSPNYPNPYSPGENCVWTFTTEQDPAKLFVQFVDLDVDCLGRSNLVVTGENGVMFDHCRHFGISRHIDADMQPYGAVQIMYHTDPTRANGFFSRGVYIVYYFLPYIKDATFFRFPENYTGTAQLPTDMQCNGLTIYPVVIHGDRKDDMTQETRLRIGVELVRREASTGRFCVKILREGPTEEEYEPGCDDYRDDSIAKPTFGEALDTLQFDVILIQVECSGMVFSMNATIENNGEKMIQHPLDLDAPHPWQGIRDPQLSLANPVKYGGIHYRAVVYQTDVVYDATVDFYITKLVMRPSPACIERYVNIRVTKRFWRQGPSYYYCHTLESHESIHVSIAVEHRQQLRITIVGSHANSEDVVEIAYRVTRNHDIPNSYCGREFLGRNGIIYSPGYPAPYGRNVECTWTIAPSISSPVVFVEFHILELDLGGVGDLLYIYNGTRSEIIDKCGHPDPENSEAYMVKVRIAAGKTAHVGFKSGNSFKGGSFRIRFFGFSEDLDLKRGYFIDILQNFNYPFGYTAYETKLERAEPRGPSRGNVDLQIYYVDVNLVYTLLPNGSKICDLEYIVLGDFKLCSNDMKPKDSVQLTEPSDGSRVIVFKADKNSTFGRGLRIYIAYSSKRELGYEGVIRSPGYPNNTRYGDQGQWIGYYNKSGTLMVNLTVNTQRKTPNGALCFDTLRIEYAVDDTQQEVDLCLFDGREYFEFQMPSQSVVVFYFKNGRDGGGSKFEIKYRFYRTIDLDKDLQNVALKKTAKQSSTYVNGSAALAVDGLANPEWATGRSCSSTDDVGNASQWWQVDLGQEYNIYGLTITNRLDCCEMKNVALRKPAYLSSLYNESGTPPMTAGLAVDGNESNQFMKGFSCSSTRWGTGEGNTLRWWYVDLGRVYEVVYVSITNNADDCCRWMLKNFYLELFTTNPQHTTEVPFLCSYFPGVFIGLPENSTGHLYCPLPNRAKYVMIRKYDDVSLNVCEVKVMALQPPNTQLENFDVELYKGNPELTSSNASLCLRHTSAFPAGDNETMYCTRPTWARYVRIRLHNVTRKLRLCEVQVLAYLEQERRKCEGKTLVLAPSQQQTIQHWFPGELYPSNQSCVWQIQIAEDAMIQYAIVRVDIDGQNDEYGCYGDEDYLLVFGEYFCGSDSVPRPKVWTQLNVQAGFVGTIEFFARGVTRSGQGFQMELSVGPFV